MQENISSPEIGHHAARMAPSRKIIKGIVVALNANYWLINLE